MPNPTLIFKFHINDDDSFTYEPPTDWKYTHKDLIRFESDSGPFELDLIRTDAPQSVNPLNNVFGGPLVSTPGPNRPWFVDTHTKDEMTDAARTIVFENHQAPGVEGFISKYRYKITAIRISDNKTIMHDDHNGIYIC